jgi:CBS domain-containing protein
MLRVQDVMQPDVISAPPNRSLAEAFDLMQQHHIRHLPVVSRQQIIGLLTDRDIRQVMPSSAAALHLEEIAEQMETIAIEACMTVPVETVAPQTSAVEAACQLLECPFDCLPVVERDRLVGIVTATDFLRCFLAAVMPAGEQMRVRDYMQTAPLTVAPSDIVRTAYHRMRCAHIRHLPVIATGRRLVGLLTDRDVRRLQASPISALAVYEQREPTYTLAVQEVMTRHVVTVEEDTPVAVAGERLLHHQIGCLPVLSSDETLKGIVTVRDLIRAYVRQQEPS